MLVPKTDADGNDVAGIRLPAVAVPTATYTGWALRAAAFAGDDLCDASGQQIAFLRAKADRLAAGDPRRSLAERYPTHAAVREALRARGEASPAPAPPSSGGRPGADHGRQRRAGAIADAPAH